MRFLVTNIIKKKFKHSKLVKEKNSALNQCSQLSKKQIMLSGAAGHSRWEKSENNNKQQKIKKSGKLQIKVCIGFEV